MASNTYKGWKYYSIEISFNKKKRIVDVYTKAPLSAAIAATGKADDETARVIRLSKLDEWMRTVSLKKVKRTEVTSFFRALESSGENVVDLRSTLPVAAAKAKTPLFRGIIANMFHERSQVESPWMLFQRYPEAFNVIEVATIRKAFISGDFEVQFRKLADKAEDRDNLMTEVVMGLWYPAMLGGLVFGLMVIFGLFVYPKIQDVFSQLNYKLHPLTRGIIFICRNVLFNPVVLLSPIVAGILLALNWKATCKKHWFQRGILRIPIVGGFIKEIILERSLQAMSELYEDGIARQEIFSTVANIASNIVFVEYFGAIYKHVQKGMGLYEGFLMERERIGKEGLDVANEIRVGAATAQEADVLRRAANNYRKKIKRFTAAIPRLVEPIMIAVLGTVIGAVFFSIFIPNMQFALQSMKEANRFTNVQATEAGMGSNGVAQPAQPAK